MLSLTPLRQPKYYQEYENALTSAQINKLIENVKNLPLRKAQISNNYPAENIRRAQLASIPTTSEFKWLYSHVTNFIIECNQKNFGYNLTHIQPIQYIEYHSSEKGMVHSHLDWYCDSQPRKLSASIQLSNSTDYEGGDLIMNINLEKPFIASRIQGNATVFPSFLMHNVTPVTTGIRRALVIWCVGPEFC